jgi:hypothetical protein
MKIVNQMTVKEIIESIEVMRNGLSLNPGEREKQILEKNIARAQAELKKRSDEKKTESQLTGNPGQAPPNVTLPTVADLQEWQKKAEKEIQKTHEEIANIQGDENDEFLGKKLVTQYANMVEREQQFETRVSVGRASETSVTIPAVFVKIAGEDRLLTKSEIVGYLKTYFKRVATSERMKAGQYTTAYASDMGKTVWRLFDGWNLIYKETQEGSEWPPMVDIFPGWKNAQQTHKITADILWRWASNRKQ